MSGNNQVGFEAVVSHAESLKKLVDALAQIATEVNVYADTTSLSLQAMDPARVCLVALESNAQDAFERYQCSEDVVIGLPLTSLSRLLKLADANDRVTLSWTPAQPDELRVRFEMPERAADFKMQLMEVGDTKRLVPSIPSAAEDPGYWKAVLPSAKFAATCRDLAALGGEELTLVPMMPGDQTPLAPLRFETKCEGFGLAVLEFPNVVHEATFDGQQPVQPPRFSARYLVSAAKAQGLAQTVELTMGEATALLIQLDTALGRLQYFLGSRLVDEDYNV